MGRSRATLEGCMERRIKLSFLLAFVAVIPWILGPTSRPANSQTAVRVAQIPGINPGPCNPGPEERRG